MQHLSEANKIKQNMEQTQDLHRKIPIQTLATLLWFTPWPRCLWSREAPLTLVQSPSRSVNSLLSLWDVWIQSNWYCFPAAFLHK